MKATLSLSLPIAVLAGLVPVLFAAAGGCKKEEPPPPPPPVAAEPSAAPPPTVDLKPEAPDAADDADADADADAKNAGGQPFDVSRIRACCAALQQNAASAPPPNNMYMASAAAYCQSVAAAINRPGQTDALLAGIRNALRGAPVPPACR